MQEDEYARLSVVEDSLWWFRGRTDLLRREVEALLRSSEIQEPRLLDAGCGTGGNLVAFKGIGRGFGLDLSWNALHHAFRRAAGKVVRGSVLQMPVKDKSIDVVLSLDVLYHQWVTDDAAALRELYRVIRPGGYLLVHVAAMPLFRGSHDVVNLTRERYLTGNLQQKIELAGFTVRRITYRNTLLAPFLLVRRWLSRSEGNEGSDLSLPPGWLNTLLYSVLKLENQLTRHMDMPFGSSAFCIARKEPLSER